MKLFGNISGNVCDALRASPQLSLLLFAAVVIVLVAPPSNLAYSQAPAGSPGNSQNQVSHTTHYGCRLDHFSTYHCDVFLNETQGSEISGTVLRLHRLSTDPPFYVDGVSGKALEMKARYRESLLLQVAQPFDADKFTISFWVKESNETVQYSQILSHVDRLGSSGWFFDMES